MTKIIWVDDEINQAELRADKDELRERGCEIVEVKSADEFINILSRPLNDTVYDGIIIDIMLPVGGLDVQDAGYGSRTGLLLLDKVKENILFQNVKVIAFSIIDDKKIADKCREAGALYLKKNQLLSNEFADKVIEFITV